ncbi:DUF3887 domain-containing protein [Candidatus Clostridium stratigraminis]|uniref:DUF3887 domain-containing protein n=1 Tax=Candidatus Clostridium stratigraminis TaxID=3381661 RepID=A0ABW8T509_9CLOT
MKCIRVFFLITLIIGASILSGCGNNINASEVRNYSDSILENILISGNKDNYADYSKDFSDNMKTAIPEDMFKKNNALIKDKIGEYVSKDFIKINTKKEKGINYIIIIYNAKYSKEPQGALVSITFKEKDENHKVEGLFMTSPKLTGN